MGDLDFKQIGLAAKDVIIGIGAAAAGAKGGSAAAEGVLKAGSGLDRLLGMAGVAETRGEKFDRADYAARPQLPGGKPAPATPPQGPVPGPQATPPAPNAAGSPQGAPAPPNPQEAPPLVGDARITVDHLSSLGWSHDKIQQILSGPQQASLAAIVGKETTGVRAPTVAGTRLLPVESSALASRIARAVSPVKGQAIPTVEGIRVDDDTSRA